MYLNKVPLRGSVFFETMNEVHNTFWYTVDKIMLERQLRRSSFTNSNCGLFTKHRETI